MKVKTLELTGKALCYTVCMIEMPHLVWGSTIGKHHASEQLVVPELPEPKCYSPYMGWDMMGPIIERERMGVWYSEAMEDEDGNVLREEHYYAEDKDGDNVQTGPTPLIAAMRCYVASRLGDEVEIPDALTGSL